MREMTRRERVQRCLRFETPDRAPRDLWALIGAQRRYGDAMREFHERFPTDFVGPRARYGRSQRATGADYTGGSSYKDEWGSRWDVGEDGVVGEVKLPVLHDWDLLSSFEPPFEILDEADFSEVNKGYAETDGYVRAGTTVRPFERLQFLRGSEQFFVDLAENRPELWKLRDMVHEFFLREMRMWADTDVDGVSMMDDWGTQWALLISPEQWRKFFKPLYADYCAILRNAGKDVWFHSDGHIEAVYPDLIEVGVTALNSQLFCMDIERLGQLYKGKVTFWGELDRQGTLAFGAPEQVRNDVRRVRKALDDGRGGVIAQCEWGIETPPERIFAAFETWLEPMGN